MPRNRSCDGGGVGGAATAWRHRPSPSSASQPTTRRSSPPSPAPCPDRATATAADVSAAAASGDGWPPCHAATGGQSSVGSLSCALVEVYALAATRELRGGPWCFTTGRSQDIES